MRFFKQPILISLLLFAAVTYVPSSHMVSYNATASDTCTENASTNVQ